MKYYYPQHIHGYARLREDGKTSWGDLHGGTGFDDFSARSFFSAVLPVLQFDTTKPTVLVYGCGTGPDACYLAERGFSVKGIDLIPAAIELAIQQAKLLSLDIDYAVQDICELSPDGEQYDVIVDSYCLQGIVTDADRDKVFSAVRARLKTEGYYLVSTAMFDEDRFSRDQVVDTETGIIYNRYGESRFLHPEGIIDAQTGIVYEILEESPDKYEDAVKIDGVWYLPNRRHLKAPAFRAELEAAGFNVLYQDNEYGGNVICALR